MKNLSERLPTRQYISLINDYHVQLHWAQSGEDTVIRRLIDDREGGFYVDIGAFHPRLFSNTYYLSRVLGWSGINVDATEKKVEIFKRERPNDVNLHTVVGATAGETVKFEIGTDSGLRNRVLNKGRKARDGSDVRSLTTTTLAAILDEHVPENVEIDLLTIDCEGLDHAVLQGNDWTKYRPEIICVEDFDIRRGRPSMMRTFLEEHGYRFVSHCYDSSIYQRGGGPDQSSISDRTGFDRAKRWLNSRK